MPTYEYRCPQGHDTERFFRKISDSTSQIECTECGAVAERRMSAGAGLLFKGSGFYLTDYGRSGGKAKKDGDSASSGGEKKGDGAKSEAPKPAADKSSSTSSTSSGTSGGSSKKSE